jgi:hypothetical protein
MQAMTTLLSCLLTVILSCLTCFSPLEAQQNKILEYKKPHALFSVKRYYLDGEKISKHDVGLLLQKESPEAYKIFKNARTTTLIGGLTGTISGILVYKEIFRIAYYNFEKKATLLIFATTGFIGGLILVSASAGRFKDAADTYNHKHASTGRLHLNFGITHSGGVGFMITGF